MIKRRETFFLKQSIMYCANTVYDIQYGIMDIQQLQLRAACANLIRKFFTEKNYLEVDVPCFSKNIIPESSIEVFQTLQTKLQSEQYYLLPSPELYIKKLLAKHTCSMFSLAHCFRAGENTGRIHNPEFTMLEYYTVDADYKDSLRITEALFAFLCDALKENPLFDMTAAEVLTTPFLCLSMNEAFIQYADISLAENTTRTQLLEKVRALGISESSVLEHYSYKDLYELVLVAVIEPALPKNKVVALMDYPLVSETLSKRKMSDGLEVTERWEIYVNGIELANCYTELQNANAVKQFFEHEIQLRKNAGMSDIAAAKDFASVCAELPNCSGVALGFERLLLVLSGSKSIENFIIR